MRTSRHKTGQYCSVTVLLLTLLLAGAESNSAQTLFPEYPLLKVGEGVSMKPGSVAWSTDGRRLAFIGADLMLYDIAGGSLRTGAISGVTFVSSGPAGTFYLLRDESGRRMFAVLDGASLSAREIPLPRPADAVFASQMSGKAVLASVSLDQKKLWAELTYRFELLDLGASKVSGIYEDATITPGRAPAADYQSGWLWPGPRKCDTGLLAVQFVRPPVIVPYLKMKMADYLTGKIAEAGRIDLSGMSAPLSWSPDGSRFAYPDRHGRLAIYAIKEKSGDRLEPETPPGAYPAWNPAGSQIYFGGFIINADGSGLMKVLDDARGSMAVWSPDGTALAIAYKGTLYLLKNFSPRFIVPDRACNPDLFRRTLLLKELLKDNLIDEREYEERYNRLSEGRK